MPRTLARVAGVTATAALIAAAPLGAPLAAQSSAPSRLSVAPFLAPGFPSELVSAKKADRIAWLVYERGVRNVYAAAAPDFRPVRLTNFTEDDGVILSDLAISDDGGTVAFVRGSEPNREGWIANPSSSVKGAERAIWAASTTGGGAWRVSEGEAPALSPDGHTVVFSREGQIWKASTARAASTLFGTPGGTMIVKAWGKNAQPRWSPDGSKVAFVSVRDNHSLIGVYDPRWSTVHYMAPSIDFDTSPTWSGDSKQIAFIRRPGTPFGLQAQRGDGSIGNPGGPATARGRANRDTSTRIDGLYRAAFPGGATIQFVVADVATGQGHEVWQNAPGDSAFARVREIAWAGDHLIFQAEPEEWARIFSVATNGSAGAATKPIVLTPGEGQVETIGLSADGRTLFYATNAGDIDRRHLFKVPTAGGDAVQLTKGSEIEMYPAPLASGKKIAALTSSATRPFSVAVLSADGGAENVIYPTLTKEWPAQVTPTNVTLKAADGVEFHNQLFLPKDLRPGEKRPAIVFVHGGPIRQMLLGYHYMDFYHTAYAVNEWLASQGYIVMSVNYRSGIGYGKSFRTSPRTGGRGNAEYGDVLAAGKYLQSREDVDPSRVGIWGLSYGGVLTSEALARNSDIFAAGVDMAGVHLWGNSLDTAAVSYKASAISAIDTWRSPVLVWANDDDRNVEFSQTIGLVELLRAHNVPFELMVNPDDTHETLIHKRWLELFARVQDFFQRNLWNKGVTTSGR